MDIIPFKPQTYARNPHIQTLLGEFSKVEIASTPYQRKNLTLSDGDQLSYNLYPGKSDFVVTLGHGLTGSSHSRYIRSISSELNKLGHNVIAYNHRNCGDGFGLAKKTYHSGRSEDLGELIHFLKSEFPGKKHISVGYSMSGNALLKLLGDPRHESDSLTARPDFAIAVNAPINIGKTSSLLNRGLNRIYQYSFIKNLNVYAGRLHSRGLLEKKYKFSNLTSMIKFDREFTGPESDYGTAQNYYDSCSAMNYLQHIKTKTVIITSEDDPFVDSKDYEPARSNSQIHLLMQKHGGHMGYISEQKLPHGSHRWLDYAILKIIENYITEQKHAYDHSSDAKISNNRELQDK